MKAICISIIIFLSVNLGFSQTWSDPVIISKPGFNFVPDFKIDRKGVMHCVWTQTFTDGFNRIYYSKSNTNGKTWSDPIPILENPSVWIQDPHIVVDSIGNLYVSFDYDTYNWPRICYIKFNFIDSTWSQQKILAPGYSNRIVIDHNDRIYFFWYAGNEFYQYLENNVMSDIFSPYNGTSIHYYFDQIIVDNQNRMYCVGNHTAGDHSHGAYFTSYNGTWSPFIDLSNNSFYESKISLNSHNIPSFVWRQVVPDSTQIATGTYYSSIESDSVEIPQLFALNAFYPNLCLDENDHPHIIECEQIDSGYQLVHRFVAENGWQKEVIEQNYNWYFQNVVIAKDSCIYMVYNKADTTLFTPPGNYKGMIEFRKLEILSGLAEPNDLIKLGLFPNPFSDKINIKVQLPYFNSIDLLITDFFGQVVYHERFPFNNLYTNNLLWNGTSSFGNQVADGCYFIQISTGTKVIVKKAIRICK